MALNFPKGPFYQFAFGQYKGLTLRQVYEGCGMVPYIKVKSLLEEFIAEIEHEYELHSYSIYTDGKFISITPLMYADNFSEDDGAYVSTEKIFEEVDNLCIRAEAIIKMIVDKLSERLFVYFDKIGKDSVLNLNDIVFRDKYSDSVSNYSTSHNNLYTVNGKPAYIEWCINNIEEFFIRPELFNALEEIKSKGFGAIRVKKITDTYYEINQYLFKIEHKFGEQAKSVNLDKYDKYLLKKKSQVFYEISESLRDKSKSDGIKRYSDQEFINDALDGEAGAYWNID